MTSLTETETETKPKTATVNADATTAVATVAAVSITEKDDKTRNEKGGEKRGEKEDDKTMKEQSKGGKDGGEKHAKENDKTKNEKKNEEMKRLFDQLYKMTIDSFKIVAAIMKPSKICIFGFYSNGSEFFDTMPILKAALVKIVMMLTYQDVHWKELTNITKTEQQNCLRLILKKDQESFPGKISPIEQKLFDYIKEYDDSGSKFEDVIGMKGTIEDELKNKGQIAQVSAEVAVGLLKLSSEIKKTCTFILDNQKLFELVSVTFISEKLHTATTAVNDAILKFKRLKR